MNQEYMPINHFVRVDILESRIDRIVALHLFKPESIKLYLDVLDELIREYNHNKDRYCIVRLSDYIKYNSAGCIYRQYTNQHSMQSNNYFNNSEIDYLRSFDDYLTSLQSTFLGVKFTIVDFHQYLLDVIKNRDKASDLDYEFMKSKVVEHINPLRFISYSINISEDNLYVYLYNYNCCISLVGNSETFQPVEQKWALSIIVLDNVPSLLSKIKDAYNITFMDYINDCGNFDRVYFQSPLVWCVSKLDRLIVNVRRVQGSQDVIARLSKAMIELKKIYNYKDSHHFRMNDLDINEIKLQKRKLIAVDDDLLEGFDYQSIVKSDLCMVIRILGVMCNTLENYFSLDSSISFALSEIKKSNTLYIISKNLKKNESIAFGEENLSAILASNLRCLFHKRAEISVNCESMVGNGRSDVRLNFGNKTIGIIESKLINKDRNVEEETTNALDQLYSRYSENENVEGHRDVKLYLVIFSYDKNFRTMAQSIRTAINDYAQRNSLDYEKIEMSENGMTFIYNESRCHLGLLNKERTIKIMICNMEIDYQSRSKQRTKRKSYTP